jgi:hypothetical protein
MAVRLAAEAAARAAGRSSWPVRRFHLGEEPGDDLSASTTPLERLAMMEGLATEAWALTGRPLPDYRRAEAPVRVRALGAPAD